MTALAAVTQQYDLAGNVTTAFSADRGTTYKYYYDHHNRLTEVRDGAGSVTQATFTLDVLADSSRPSPHDSSRMRCRTSRVHLGCPGAAD